MITCDTSVQVAAFARWHADHARAAAALRQVDALVDHVVIETYSVLTRLPPPHRVPAQLVTGFLDAHFPPSTQRLPSVASSDVLAAAHRCGITGGAVYDLLVALTAANGRSRLLSLDRRAAATYDASGVDYELIS